MMKTEEQIDKERKEEIQRKRIERIKEVKRQANQFSKNILKKVREKKREILEREVENEKKKFEKEKGKKISKIKADWEEREENVYSLAHLSAKQQKEHYLLEDMERKRREKDLLKIETMRFENALEEKILKNSIENTRKEEVRSAKKEMLEILEEERKRMRMRDTGKEKDVVLDGFVKEYLKENKMKKKRKANKFLGEETRYHFSEDVENKKSGLEEKGVLEVEQFSHSNCRFGRTGAGEGQFVKVEKMMGSNNEKNQIEVEEQRLKRKKIEGEMHMKKRTRDAVERGEEAYERIMKEAKTKETEKERERKMRKEIEEKTKNILKNKKVTISDKVALSQRHFKLEEEFERMFF